MDQGNARPNWLGGEPTEIVARVPAATAEKFRLQAMLNGRSFDHELHEAMSGHLVRSDIEAEAAAGDELDGPIDGFLSNPEADD